MVVIETHENLSDIEMSNRENDNIESQENAYNHSPSDENNESGSFESDNSDDTPTNNMGLDENQIENNHKLSNKIEEILEDELVATPNILPAAVPVNSENANTTNVPTNENVNIPNAESSEIKTTTTVTVTESEVTVTPTTKPLLPRIFNQIVLTLENSLIPAYKLEATPSHLDGLDSETEKDLRILGCEFIQTAGILLRLPQVAMATGQVIFQRFFYSKSFVRHGMETVAMSCVCLASKIEEAPRRIRDVINVFHHIKQVRAQREIAPMVLDQYYTNLKTQVIKAERRVLKELGFCVHVKHPHKLIVMYLQVIRLETNEQLMQMSWNFMNDSLRTDCFMRYNPETIACACIYLSARKLNIPLPYEPPWFGVFNVAEDDVVDISYRIMELYMRAKPSVEKLDAAVDELKKRYTESRNRTKEQNSSPAVTTIDRNNGLHNAWGGFIQRTIPLPLFSEKSDYKNSSRSSHSMSRTPKYRSRTSSHSIRSRSPTPGSVDYNNKHHHNSKKSHRNRSRTRSRSPHGKGKKKTTRHFSRSPSKSLSPHSKHRKRKLSRERERSEYYNIKDVRFNNNEKYRDRERYEREVHRSLSNHRSSSKHQRRNYAHHGNNNHNNHKHRETDRSRDRKR